MKATSEHLLLLSSISLSKCGPIYFANLNGDKTETNEVSLLTFRRPGTNLYYLALLFVTYDLMQKQDEENS
ncbi:MAG: hypothetical protein H0U57_14555 [Tatlockia sp.]|nr:hypothetical protein [Tatlockia sp.]